MKNKILLIIDAQYDFISGSLKVVGAENAMNNLAKFIQDNGNEYDKIILTADWHPNTHCSFINNGGIWPPHCVQFTNGASIFDPIISALDKSRLDYVVLTKGLNEDREEYSIFKNEESSKKVIDICNAFDTKEIDVAGLAFDYCVASSVKDGLRSLPNVKFNVIKEFSPSIAESSEKDFKIFIDNSERINLI